MKRIVLLGTVGILVAAMLAASALSVSAQDYSGQYASDDQYASTTGQAAPVCAPWSKEWDISKGKWWYEWYRWCYDPATSDPAYEASWYRESGGWKWGEPANLCPESGKCTISTDSGGNDVQMSTDTTTSPVTDTPTGTTTPTATDTQTPADTPPTDTTTPVTDTQTPTESTATPATDTQAPANTP